MAATVARAPYSPSLSITHPVWRAAQLDRGPQPAVPTGHAALDAQLPGGGWPIGSLVEILQASEGIAEWRLLAPALGRFLREQRRPAVLVAAPLPPFGPSLAASGLDPAQLLYIDADSAASRQWACEQALQCAEPAAVLAWLPKAQPDGLRRLQVVAHDHEKLLLTFRPLSAQTQSSPASLRLTLSRCIQDAGALDIHILKRRGPPLDRPLTLRGRPARLAASLVASRSNAERRRQPGVAPAIPPLSRTHHEMDRPLPTPIHG